MSVNEKMTAIADQLRALMGGTDKLSLDGMATAGANANTAMAAISAAIQGKGVTVPEGTKLGGLAALVDSIQAGGAGGTLTVIGEPNANIDLILDPEGERKTVKSGQTGSDGKITFEGLESGRYQIDMYVDGQYDWKVVEITTDYSVLMSFSTIPSFTYDGEYEIVNDADEAITTSADNWKIRFLTSGTLIFTELRGAWNGIDVFLVGGGSGSVYSATYMGGGGSGGFTRTVKNVSVKENTEIAIKVGAGGAAGGKWSKVGDGPTDGGSSSFGDYQAAGGYGQTTHVAYTIGCSGGTAGQIYRYTASGSPAIDGNDGKKSSNGTAGKGQRSTPGPNGETGTTGEFGDETALLYSTGGCYTGSPRPNSGDAGRSSGKANTYGTDGGSGIVIIRNAREVA